MMSVGWFEVFVLVSDIRCGIYCCEIMYRVLILILGVVSNLLLLFLCSVIYFEVVFDIFDGMG